MQFSTVKYFENLGDQALSVMQTNDELSGYIIEIDPEQNVLSTDELKITVKLRPNGTAKFISISLGFTL